MKADGVETRHLRPGDRIKMLGGHHWTVIRLERPRTIKRPRSTRVEYPVVLRHPVTGREKYFYWGSTTRISGVTRGQLGQTPEASEQLAIDLTGSP